MRSRLLSNTKKRLLRHGRWGLLAILLGGGGFVVTVGGIGAVAYDTHASRKDYDEIESCLLKHNFTVIDGWKYTDMGLEIIGYPALENFGLDFATSNGQQWEIEVIDGYGARDCNDRIAWVWIEHNTQSTGTFLPLHHPELLKDLDGIKIQTTDDLLAQLEWLLDWTAEHPETLYVTQEEFWDEYDVFEPGGLIYIRNKSSMIREH